jgi:hypothetical protein
MYLLLPREKTARAYVALAPENLEKTKANYTSGERPISTPKAGLNGADV